MNSELKRAAQQALEALTFIRRQLKSWDRGDSVIDALRTALAQQPATGEPVEDGIRNAEDELNCAEEVLDAITCEFSDGEFPVTDFNCIGDYITAVVDVFKERLAAQQPATGEPVAWMASYVDPIGNDHVYVTSHHDLAVENDMHGTPRPLVFGDTHPAPSGLGDSKRLDYLQDRGATIDLIAGVAAFYPMRFRVGGLDSSANIDVRAAIDAAMLAAKEAT